MRFFAHFSLTTLVALILSSKAFGADHIINQKSTTFSQENLVISKGDKVIFKNDDNTAHNVFSSSTSDSFNLKIQKPGSENEYVFNNPGEVEVRCAIHPKMKLKITVK